MAYLKRMKKKNGTIHYYSYITSVKWSKSKYISLKTDSKVTARVRHSEVERNEKDIKNGMDISFAWENDEGRTLVKQMTYQDAIKQWLGIKETNVSKSSYRRYIVSMNCFMNVVGDVTPLSSITNQNIEDFKRYYSKFHTPCGVNINLRGIKAFLRWSFDEGLIEVMPKIVMMKEDKRKPKALTESNWRDLMELDSLDSFWKDVFRLYVTTGMRRGEAIDGYLDGSILIVPSHKSKTRRELEIPLNDFQLNVVKQLHSARDNHLDKGSKMVTFKSKVSKVFTNACKKVGIYEDKRTTLHCLRHTFALMKYLETRDLYEVCKRLNHTSIKTTERYSQFSFQRLEQDYPSIVENGSKVAKIDDMVTNNMVTNDSEGYISPLLMN